jgi:C-terminal processing protease CtpA/Prc
LKVLREGRESPVKLRVEPLRAAAGGQGERLPEVNGLTIGNAERNGRPEAVAVISVEPGSPAWAHGFRPGDLIVGVNRHKTRTTRELMAALRTEGPLAVSVLRGDSLFAIVLRR